MKIIITSISLLLLIAALSCTTDSANDVNQGPIIMPVNPNGDSELALLMRDMFDEGMAVKTKIQNGEMPNLLLDFEKIHSAEATEPEKKESPAYKVHAESYLQAIDALKKAHADDLEKSYNRMVDACMGCHRALCPGPMVRIKKMYL